MTNTFISNTAVTFEGLTRPVSLLLFRDDSNYDKYKRLAIESGQDPVNLATEKTLLERYLSDVQNLFLKKFAVFTGSDQVSEQESHKLRSLLEEMIKVKTLIATPFGEGDSIH